MNNKYGPLDIDFLRLTAVTLAIQSRYEGGVEKFKEEGGNLAAVPGNVMTVVVYHPNFPEDLKNEFINHQEELSVEFRFTDVLNFKDMDLEKVQDILNNHFMDTLPKIGLNCAIYYNEIVVSLMVLNARPSDNKIEQLRTLLKTLPGLRLGSISYRGRVEWIEAKGPGHIKLEVAAREKVIGDDDLMDLKIALETDPWKLFE